MKHTARGHGPGGKVHPGPGLAQTNPTMLSSGRDTHSSQGAPGKPPGSLQPFAGSAGLCSLPRRGHSKSPAERGHEPRIADERTSRGKRSRRHQSRGAMNISCPGLHTARLSPPRAPGGLPQPPITTKGSADRRGRTPQLPPPPPGGPAAIPRQPRSRHRDPAHLPPPRRARSRTAGIAARLLRASPEPPRRHPSILHRTAGISRRSRSRTPRRHPRSRTPRSPRSPPACAHRGAGPRRSSPGLGRGFVSAPGARPPPPAAAAAAAAALGARSRGPGRAGRSGLRRRQHRAAPRIRRAAPPPPLPLLRGVCVCVCV